MGKLISREILNTFWGRIKVSTVDMNTPNIKSLSSDLTEESQSVCDLTLIHQAPNHSFKSLGSPLASY